MKWIKKGLIFSEKESIESGLYNPQVPYAFKIEDKIRIFFGARKDNNGGAAVYYIDVDRYQPQKILQISKQPVLSSGARGAFDEDGVLPVCLIKTENELYMYYGGFTKHITHPHTCMMGLAISKDNGQSFERISKGPILPISRFDPYLIGSADIVIDKDIWHMIYTSGTKWSTIEDSLEISYTLKYAYSKNGIDWQPTEQIVIPQEEEFDAFAKPSIFKHGDTFVMYFSKRQIINYRKKGESAYSLGLATSKDLFNWERNDKISGIDTSDEGWDSEMICYPNVVEINGRHLMFYNGNGFGKSGFGFAELAELKIT